MKNRRLADELLIAGLEDWLHLADIEWFARRFVKPGERRLEVISVGVETLAGLLAQELIEIGEVSDGGFFEWDATHEEAIARVEQGWRELGRDPRPGDVCWVANTEGGDKRAREIIAARRVD